MRTASVVSAVLTAIMAAMAYAVYTFAGPIVVTIALATALAGAGVGALTARKRSWSGVWFAGSVGAIVGFVAGTAVVLAGLAALFADWP